MSTALKFRYPFILMILLLAMLAACSDPEVQYGPIGPAGPAGPMGPIGPAGENASANQEYVGSDRCGQCHEDQYETFVLSGHPNDLTKIENGEPPVFPYDAETGGVSEPPEGYTWEDISYVVGGYGWSARFVDQKGYIITGNEGDTTQYNYPNDDLDAPAGWVSFHAGEQVPSDCGGCHSTGYKPEGHQNNLEGIAGTWEFPGVQCEVCHGPGSRHADEPYGVQMVVDRSSQMCGNCHSRDEAAVIDAVGEFENHNQQYDDLFNSKHFAISCVTCHNPHASTLYADEAVNPNQGIIQQCESCHWQNTQRKVRIHSGQDCIDCHMPKMAVSAQGNIDLMRGDIRSHQFAINPDSTAPQFNEDGSQVLPYLTLDYVCGQCHNGQDADIKEPSVMESAAQGYHDLPTPTPEPPTLTPEPEATPETTATPAS